jgi:hypothetical protein
MSATVECFTPNAPWRVTLEDGTTYAVAAGSPPPAGAPSCSFLVTGTTVAGDVAHEPVLAYTGAPLELLAPAGLGLVLAGAALVRRAQRAR